MGLALNTRSMVCSRSCPSLSWSSPTSPAVTSGGVDPSAVAAMLWAEGHNLVGLTTQFWNPAHRARHKRMSEGFWLPEVEQAPCKLLISGMSKYLEISWVGVFLVYGCELDGASTKDSPGSPRRGCCREKPLAGNPV